MAQIVHTTIQLDNGKSFTKCSRLEIAQTMQMHHQFWIECPIDVLEDSNGLVINKSQEHIGKGVTITLSNPKDNSPYFSFNGIVTNISLSRKHGSYNNIIIKGYSTSILLETGASSVSFLEQKLDDIANTIFGNHSSNTLEKKIKPKYKKPLPYFVQYKESDYHFLSRLAAIYGEWFFYDGKKMCFGELETGDSVDLKLGLNLLDFDLSLKVLATKFKHLAYDYHQNETYEHKSESVSIPGLNQFGESILKKSKENFDFEPQIINRELVNNKEELEHFVTSRVAALSGDFVVFSGTSNSADLQLGSTIKITGTKSSSEKETIEYGEYLVIELMHHVDVSGNYINQFRAIASDASYPPLNRNIKAIFADTQVATVLDNNDPDDMGRVKAQFFWQKSDAETPWIRVAFPSGGAGKGFFFMPEIGDEVLVSFEDGNPNKPYVVGSVYHKNMKTTEWKSDKNYMKSIKTPSGNQISFNDEDGKNEIKIFNAGNENEISLSLEGDGSISITSKGDISISATKSLSMSAKEISMSAEKTITITAGTDLTANSTKTTLSSSADTEINAKNLTANVDVKLALNSTELSSNSKTGTIASTAKLTVNGGALAEITAAIVKLN